MIRIAIDMDEVIADTVSSLLDWYGREHGQRWTREMLAGKYEGPVARVEQRSTA